MENNNELNHDKKQTDINTSSASHLKSGKKQIQVINVPKRRKKKKTLRTPSHIIRLCLIWCFVLCLFLLTYPFLNAQLYINEKLEITPYPSSDDFKLATQEQIDTAEKELKSAMNNLVEVPKDNENSTDNAGENSLSESSTRSSEQDLTSSTSKNEYSVKEMNTAHYSWKYNISKNVDIESTMKLLDEAMNIDRTKYTEESAEELNSAVLNVQRTLCASVVISQSAIQMMIGGSINESFGSYDISVGDSVLRGLLSFALAVIPIVCFLAASFDKRRHIKHVIIMIGTILAIADIYFTIYPYIGIGATLSIALYIIICILNIASIYAKQQEDYIVNHPEKEAEFTEKHPQFVKALINEKALGNIQIASEHKKDEYISAKNAKKHYNKMKKKKNK